MAGTVEINLLTGLRYFTYAVTPNETSFERVEDVPNYVQQVTPYFILAVLLEYVICMATGTRKLRLSNDGYISMSQGLCSEIPKLFARSAELAAYMYIYDNWRIMELPWNSAITWWLAFFGVDIGYYWFHRYAHESNILWAAHQVHHSSEDYNLSTALRQSVLQKYTSWVFYIPLAFFIPPSVFLVHIQFNLLYQFWIHTELVELCWYTHHMGQDVWGLTSFLLSIERVREEHLARKMRRLCMVWYIQSTPGKWISY
ncbi:unnamed protein product, partial [Owenia fusiformis]